MKDKADGRNSSQANAEKHEDIVCTRCGKCFTLRSSLSRHMKMHIGHFKYYCDQCKQGFPDVTHYNDHMRKHEGMKYYCEYCGKTIWNQKAI